MIERNRAWRRRKARVILSKIKKTREWVAHKFEGQKPNAELKQHQPGKLTHVQDLKLYSGLNDESHDSEWQSNAAYHFPSLALGCMFPR